MAERYLSIINISLILATVYCSYSYTNLDKSNRQKHINCMITLILIYNCMYIYMREKSLYIKDIYLMSSSSSVYLIMWIKNYKLIKSRNKIYTNIFYILNIAVILKVTLYSYIDLNIIFLPMLLNITNLYFVFRYMKLKNSILIVFSVFMYSTTIISGYKFMYLASYIVTLLNNISILINIINRSLCKISLKEKDLSGDIKRLDLSLKMNLDKFKINTNITKDMVCKLDNKNKLLDMILNQSNKCVLIIDKDGYISNEDDSFSNLWKDYKDCKYKIKLSSFLEESIENNIEVLLDIQKVYDLGISFNGEMISKDGRYFECSYAPFKINKYNIGVVCAINDITYRKQSQKQIYENQMKYKKIIETIPYSILLTDEKDIIYTNNKENEINIYDENLKNIIMDIHKKGEFSYLCEDGIEKTIIINKTSFLEDNEINNLVIVRDITNYTDLLEKIKSSRKKYESLVNIIPEGIYMCDIKDGKCLYGNDKLFEIMEAKNLREINSSDIKSKMAMSLIEGSDTAKFTRHKIKTGQGCELYVELGSITMEINNSIKGIGIIRDITEQVKAENIEKEIRRKKLEYKQKNDFFVNMSHELKTPLNLITSTNQLVQSVYRDEIINNPKGEISRVTNIVKKQGYISLGLIENIMTLTKLESDFYESSLDCYDIVSIVEDIVIELNKYVKNNDIEIIFDTYTEEKIINIDPYDIEKIILAIFSKVIKEANKNSVVYIYICDSDDNINIIIENKGGYNKNIGLSKQSKETIDMNIEVAKSIIKLYNGSIDIVERNNDIQIEINIRVNSKVDYYNKKERILNSESIYAEYARINIL